MSAKVERKFLRSLTVLQQLPKKLQGAGVGLSAGNSTFPAKRELCLGHLHGIQQETGIPGHVRSGGDCQALGVS